MKQKITRNGDICPPSCTYIILSCLPVMLVLATAFLIVCNSDFGLGDDFELLTSICSGTPNPGLLYQNAGGRFNWSRSEYNFLLLTPFNDSPLAFYAVSAVQYFVFSLFTLLLLRDAIKRTETVTGRLVLLGIWLTLHFGTHWAFFCLVQPERLQITLLSAFCYFLLRARGTDRWRYYIASLALAGIATYCKEPMFGAFAVMGILILLSRQGGRKARFFAFGLFVIAAIYLALYVLLVLPKITELYRPNGTGGSKFVVMIMASRNSPLMAACLVLATAVTFRNVLYMASKAFSKKDGSSSRTFLTMEDAFLFSGAAYAVGIVLTGGTLASYFFPVLALSYPALLLHIPKLLNKNKWLRMVMIILSLAVSAYYAHYYAGTAAHRIKYGHREMDEMRLLARFVDDGGELIWYDKENFKDTVINWKAGCLPFFIDYINGTDSFVLNRTDKLPSGLSGESYVISWDEVPEYEAAAYPELPITMFHVYYGKGNDVK